VSEWVVWDPGERVAASGRWARPVDGCCCATSVYRTILRRQFVCSVCILLSLTTSLCS
jgi:hypothetical protein